MSTNETQIPTEPVKKRRAVLRPAVLIPVGVVLAALLVLELTYFQFHKKFIDDKVDEAVPEGFVPVTEASEPTPTAAPAATVPPATTSAPAPTDAASPGSAPAATSPAPTTPAVPDTQAPSGPMVTEFVSRSHGTSGIAYYLADADGNLVLRIEDLDTDNGPDLKVYLSTNTPDGDEGDFDEDFVNLGKLKGNIGDQNYEVPPGTDVTRFKSVVIWCDRFDVAFGAAPAPMV
jgi:hypothetical protein